MRRNASPRFFLVLREASREARGETYHHRKDCVLIICHYFHHCGSGTRNPFKENTLSTLIMAEESAIVKRKPRTPKSVKLLRKLMGYGVPAIRLVSMGILHIAMREMK
jgi:hypothetical protein